MIFAVMLAVATVGYVAYSKTAGTEPTAKTAVGQSAPAVAVNAPDKQLNSNNMAPVVNPALDLPSTPQNQVEPLGRGMEQERKNGLVQAEKSVAEKEEKLPTGVVPVQPGKSAKGEATAKKASAISSSPRAPEKENVAGSEPPVPIVESQAAPEPSRTPPQKTTTQKAQGAPASSVSLEGIIFNNDPEKRSAIVRVGGGSGMLVKIGDSIGNLKVAAIEREKVVLDDGAKKTDLRVE
ncbi:MAG: hypothetical protein HY280_00610 [Nitrospinae bacterium]|nr:hypothetical protein [Nitrospinota bacterium]